MRDGKLINGVVIQPTTQVNELVHLNYGMSTFFKKKLEQRFELTNEIPYELRRTLLSKTFKKRLYFKIIYLLNFLIPQKITLKPILRLNILIYSFLNTYKGYRHLKGFPANGQRTWSNGWSSYRSNTYLRSFKLNLAGKFYGNISYTDIKIAFLSEQTNLLWKQQWYKLWKKVGKTRGKKIAKKKRKKLMRPDLVLMSKGHLFIPLLKKDLTKKEKTKKHQSLFACGYRVGFTKLLLRDLFKLLGLTTPAAQAQRSLLTPVVRRRKIKKKPIDWKVKRAKHKLKKKKKKSVWA